MSKPTIINSSQLDDLQTAEQELTAGPERIRHHEGAASPGQIYYRSENGKFLIDVGSHYRAYSRRGPVERALKWHFENQGQPEDDAETEAAQALGEIEIRHAIDWSGPIAGYCMGPIVHPTGKLLVTTSPAVHEPVAGDWPTIKAIIDQVYGHTPEQRDILLGWWAGGYAAVRSGVHQAAPLLATAGQVKSGKSLIAWITAQLLGGRIGHPHAAWSGKMLWNDDLVGSELLLVDDSVGSTDYRARQTFAARFKEAIYGPEIQLRKRHATALSVRPVWRVMFCCNDTPSALEVLPPLDEDMSDKMILLKAQPVKLPVDTSTPEGKADLQNMIRGELPALAQFLLHEYVIPDELSDRRGGVVAWRHPELVQALNGLTPAQQLRELILLAFDAGIWDLALGGSCSLTAAELVSALTHYQSSTATQAKSILRGAKLAGRHLGELAMKEDSLVKKAHLRNGVQYWRITRPGVD